MQAQSAFIPNINNLTNSDEWTSVHHHLPINAKAPLLVVYRDTHGAGVTSAILERGKFLSVTNRALVRGVQAWRFIDE
ncbi:hypothetical protein ELY33_16605 [Vreelandella andesensis]|uniref:Uncharacterized protein n=1 Tax=Vreelandella andesensis TaxID=447567 RepID=A0A3S0XXB3_9GAMM|nr:hypothetical protein [Halomonas andesensis]RUR26730.1 hypothetical protein ELY33_16605 [Halomonas andesensis]